MAEDALQAIAKGDAPAQGKKEASRRKAEKLVGPGGKFEPRKPIALREHGH